MDSLGRFWYYLRATQGPHCWMFTFRRTKNSYRGWDIWRKVLGWSLQKTSTGFPFDLLGPCWCWWCFVDFVRLCGTRFVRCIVLCDVVFGTCIMHFVRLFSTLSSVRCIVLCIVLYIVLCIVLCDVLCPMFGTRCIVHHSFFGRLRVRQRYPSLSAADKTKWSETA